MIAELRAALIVGCVLLGLFFTLVSTTGVLRLPDIYSRAHTASQADTLGAGFALAAVALAIGLESTAVKTVLLLFFIFVTNPTAAHAIARAAHEEGVEPWTTDDDRTDVELAPESAARRTAAAADGGPEDVAADGGGASGVADVRAAAGGTDGDEDAAGATDRPSNAGANRTDDGNGGDRP